METDNNMDRGWSWVVLFASFGSYCLIGASKYSIGIIHTTLLDRYNADVSTTSWASALHTTVSFACAPLSSYVIDRVSCRLAIILSGIFYTTGFFLTAFAPNIHVAILTNGFIAGVGSGLGYTACLVVVGFNFKRYRNAASGVALSGLGIGMFCLAPLIQLANTHYGAQGFFIILAAISANIVTFGMMCFPSPLEIRTHKMREDDISTNKEQTVQRCQYLRGYARVILNKGISCLYLCMIVYHFGLISIFLYLPSYVQNKGLSPLEASYTLSITGITSAIGRLVFGAVANLNKISIIVLFITPLTIVSIITFILPVLPNVFSSYIAYSVCLGLFFSGCFVLLPSVTLLFVPIQYLSTSLGLNYLTSGIGCLAGPVIAGAFIKHFESYDVAFLFSAICCAVSSVLGFVLICFRKRDDETLQNDNEIEIETFLKPSNKTVTRNNTV